MATAEGKVPVFESASQAVKFLREHLRFVLGVAAIASAAQTLGFLTLGLSLPWMLLLGIIGAGAHAALLGVALKGPEGAAARLFGDGARVFAAMAMVGFFMAIISFMVLYVAMSVLIAPYAEQAQAAAQDNERLMEIMNTTIAAQPSVITWALVAGGVLLFLLTSRFFLAAPASVAEARIVVFASWRWTKGNLLRIAATRIVLLGPALILVGALQSIAGLAVGTPGGDPAALAAAAQGNPVGFAVFYVVAGFIQLALYGGLEAGLAAYLYKGLRPPSASPPA